MKIVLISDTHLTEPKIPDGDILVHAGDLTMQGSRLEIRKAASWLNSLPHPYKIVIAGNHDWLFQLDRYVAIAELGDDIVYLENQGATIAGLNFWGSPVQPTFCDWAFNVDRGEPIRKYWDKIPDDLDVLVTHGPPAGILDQSVPDNLMRPGSEHCGCEELLLALKRARPRVHVFGHIHGSRGIRKMRAQDTVCYNASVVDETYKLWRSVEDYGACTINLEPRKR